MKGSLYLASDFLLFRLKNYNYSLRKTTICIHRINNLLFFPETPIKKTNIFLPKRSSSSFRILILTTYRQFIDIFHLQKSPKQSILQLLSSTNSFQPVHTTNRTSIRHDRAKFKVKTRVSVPPTPSSQTSENEASIVLLSLPYDFSSPPSETRSKGSIDRVEEVIEVEEGLGGVVERP